MQERVARAIGRIAGTGKAGSAERPLGDTALGIAAEDDAHSLQFKNVPRSLPAHRLNGILIAEVEPSLCRIEGMGFPRIILAERGVDPALSRHRVAANRMNF